MVFDDLEGAVREQTGVDFGTHFGNPRLPKPQLFARLLSQGYLQIHLPNETTKEKVM